MTDPWEAILANLEPDYKILKEMLEFGPRIFADLSQRGRKWVIALQEDLDLIDNNKLYSEDYLGEKVDWSVKQLETWSNVKRISYDQWEFKTKKDAEKFQLIFNLKWAR